MRALSVMTLASSLLLAVPNIAFPCGNGVYLRTDEATQLVAKAEKALEKKQNRRVLKLLADPDLEFESAPLGERRMELVAVANVRVGNVAAGLASLRWLSERKSSPVIKARLAEALSRDKAQAQTSKAEALQILETLEKDDLMPDADAWSTLATLRKNKKDPAGQDRAISECRKMAKDPSTCPKIEPQS
jgi:hypothetical protein